MENSTNYQAKNSNDQAKKVWSEPALDLIEIQTGTTQGLEAGTLRQS